MKVQISEVIVGSRFRKDMGDIDELAESIKEEGLLHPIVVLPDKTLVCGERRLLAAKKLGWKEISARQVNVNSLLKAERAENVVRKDFTPTEMVAIGREIEKKLTQNQLIKNSRRTPAHSITGRRASKDGAVTSIVANALGVTPTAYRRAKAVVEAAEGNGEFSGVVKAMDSGGATISESYETVKASGGRRRPYRKNKGDRFVAASDYQKTVASKHRERLIAGLSQISGTCQGLSELDLGIAVALMDNKEIVHWSKKASACAKSLRKFSQSILKRTK